MIFRADAMQIARAWARRKRERDMYAHDEAVLNDDGEAAGDLEDRLDRALDDSVTPNTSKP